MKSVEYARRKKQILQARMVLSLALISLVLLILALSVAEWYTLFDLLDQDLSVGILLRGISSYILFSFLFCICISRIALHIVYFFEHAKIAFAVFSLLIFVLYFFAWQQFDDAISLFYLGISKVTSLVLCLRYWDMLLSELRLQSRLELALKQKNEANIGNKSQKLRWSQKIPKDFIKNWHDFSACKWVVVACLFLNVLGFVMALSSHESIGLVKNWEGLVLIVLYFSVYLVFLRNPGSSTQTM